MGYELKHILAVCLIVKLVALSTEFSIRPQTDTLKQGSDTVKPPQLTSLAGVKEPWVTQMDEKSQGAHFNLGPGGTESNDIRKFNKKHITKSEQVRINPAFDTCEHMAKLLETSKWRDIQKTLHWLNRALASSSNNLRNCRRKFGKAKPKFGILNKKLNFYSSKINSKSKNYFEMKKFSDTVLLNCGQNLINSLTPNSDSKQTEKLKNMCQHKYKLGKNKLKRLYPKKSRGKTKNRNYSRKKILEKHRHYLTERPIKPNNVTVASNDVFSNSEKLYYNEKKNDLENFGGVKVDNRKSGFENAVKTYNLEEKLEHSKQVTNQELASKEKISEKWPISLEKSEGKNYKKENPWPNFVYHRVSSDLFHLGSTAPNHKQSAYVAISVNTSGVPEIVRNKKKNFGL